MGSALLDNTAAEPTPDALRAAVLGDRLGNQAESAGALRRQAAERLAAHRSRRATHTAGSAVPSAAPRNTRSARIAAAVAERYAQTPTYRDFLAAEADRAVQQAHAAAEVMALKAQAMAAAHQDLLRSLIALEEDAPSSGNAFDNQDRSATGSSRVGAVGPLEHEPFATPSLWPELESADAVVQSGANPRRFSPPGSRTKQTRHSAQKNEAASAEGMRTSEVSSSAQTLADGITIRLYQDENGATRVSLDPPAMPSAHARMRHELESAVSDEEARLLDEEIAFRHEPVFEEPAGPPMPLPANLIEFPRQLIASRKARPRLAEGPLRDEAEEAPGASQLRIFEVDPAQIATTPEASAAESVASSAQWTTIWLDSRPKPQTNGRESTETEATVSAAPQPAVRVGLPEIASVQRRLLAAAVNGAILAGAFAMFAVVSLWIAGHLWTHGAAMSLSAETRGFLNRAVLQAALPFAVCAFALLGAIYQALFFSLSTATPGMRAARIALCTFTEQNPTRGAVRRRLLALLLSSAPMGLGFLWAALDEERLSWHDRICGIYQRSY